MGKRLPWICCTAAATALATLVSFDIAKAVQPAPYQVYSTLGGTEKGGDSFNTGGPIMANAVMTSYARTQIIQVIINVKLEIRDLGSFDIFVSRIGPDGRPLSIKTLGNVSDKFITREFRHYRLRIPGTVLLAKNMKYYFGIRKHVGAHCSIVWGNTTDPTVLSRGEVKSGGVFYNSKGEQPNSSGPYEMSVNLEGE